MTISFSLTSSIACSGPAPQGSGQLYADHWCLLAALLWQTKVHADGPQGSMQGTDPEQFALSKSWIAKISVFKINFELFFEEIFEGNSTEKPDDSVSIMCEQQMSHKTEIL